MRFLIVQPSSGTSRRLGSAAASGLVFSALLVAGHASSALAAPTPEFRAADTGTFQEFVVPTPDSAPAGITRGHDANLWFSENGAANVGRVTPAGAITEFPVAGSTSGITAGPPPDKTVWFAESPDKVGKISPAGGLTEYPVANVPPPQGNGGEGITAGPDGNIWLTETLVGQIARITPNGDVSVFPAGVPRPTDIVAGPGGRLWYTDFISEKIVSITTSGTNPTVFSVPDGTRPLDIVQGPDHNLWFTSPASNSVGRMTPSGAVRLFPVPSDSAAPSGITVGPDGNLWFTERAGNKIGRITLTGVITEVHIPTPASRPGSIVTGPDGKLWFTETAANKIANLDPGSLMAPARPCLTISRSTTLTHDVGPCRGDGIVVKGRDTVLNLNHHKVFAATGPRFGDFAGIHLLGSTEATVTGGTVMGFDAGVFLDAGSANTVSAMRIVDNLGPPDPANDLGDGIAVIHSGANTIANNLLRHDGPFDGIGLLGVDTNDNTIHNNTVTLTTDELTTAIDGAGTGIIITPFLEANNPRRGESLHNNNVVNNTITRNANSGISDLSNLNATVAGNDVEGNGFQPDGSFGNFPGNGLGVQSLQQADQDAGDTVRANLVKDNASDGIQILSNTNHVLQNDVTGNQNYGIEVNGHSNRITDNLATGNAFGDLQDSSSFPDGCDSNVWNNNVYGTAFPACAASGGRQVSNAAAASGTAAPLQRRAPTISPERTSRLG